MHRRFLSSWSTVALNEFALKLATLQQGWNFPQWRELMKQDITFLTSPPGWRTPSKDSTVPFCWIIAETSSSASPPPPSPRVKSTTQQKLRLNSSSASSRLRGHQRLSRAARVTASLAASYCWVTTGVFGVWAAVLQLAVRDGTGWRLHYLGCFPSARTGTGWQVAVEIPNAPEGDMRVVSCHYLRGLDVLHRASVVCSFCNYKGYITFPSETFRFLCILRNVRYDVWLQLTVLTTMSPFSQPVLR